VPPTASDDDTLRALRRSEALFRSLWETTDDAVLMVGSDNCIAFANPAVELLLGHKPAALVGTSLSLLMPARLRQGHEHGMQRHMATGVKHVDWRGTRAIALHADGSERPVEIRFARLELDGNTLFVGFLRDLRSRLAAEEEARAAREQLEQRVAERTHELVQANQRLQQLDRLKSDFLASMSHELRTPLNSILGFTGVLLLGMAGPLTEEQRRQLGFVKGSGEHLLSLINDLLDVSRIESGRMEITPEDFDLVAVAEEVVSQLRPLAERKALGLVLQPGAQRPLTICSDRRRVYQVLLNLAGNAVKFTEQGGVRLVLGLDAAAATAWVEVHDSGIGIAPDQLPRLFEAFHQVEGGLARSHEGTGLGLHLSRRLLELLGGHIEVESRPGAGSVFRVALPLRPDTAGAAP
jgi:PAS domain S-box-containing protein